jgi:signal transduction histidine kinase/ligand-binding sensor domain-containing protein/DNA-binding response OmpR family regulator
MKNSTIYRKFIACLLLTFSISVYGSTDGNLLRFNHLTVDDGLSQNTVQAIAKDKYGFMWFGTWEGVSRYDGYTFRIFRADEDNPNALSNNRINAIITDSTQNIWVLTGDNRSVFRFNYETETFTRFSPAKVSKSIVDKLNSYRLTKRTAANKRFSWFSGSDGLIQTDRVSHKQTVFRSNKNTSFTLTDNTINALYLDDCDILWLGTQNGGVNFVNLRHKLFDYYSVVTTGNDFADNVIRAICQDKSGKLWVGTDAGGIVVIDRSGNEPVYTHYGKDKLINLNIRSIHCDRFGFVWIGTKGGLDRFDPGTGRFHHYYAGATGSISNPWVFWIMEDHNGYLWVGTFAGIAKYDRIKDRFLCYNPATTLRSDKVRVILEDHRNNLWVATEGGGITRLQRDSSKGFAEKLTPVHYRHISGNENSLINDMVLTMTEDEDKKLWIGTNSGLCRLDLQTGNFRRFSVKTGFPDDLIMGLLTDGKGHIWISHKKGLTCMDIRTFSFRTFNRYDGLQGNEFTQNAYYLNPVTGEMFFGGTNGLNAFFPDKTNLEAHKLRPVLTGLRIMNQSVEPGCEMDGRVILRKSLLCTDRITLTWPDVSFSLEFSSLNFQNPHGCRFKYKLEGIDPQWIYTDASMREAVYMHLPSGVYTFKVFASNSDGIWSDRPATVQIEILPPWWFSWWAYLLYFIPVCMAGWLVFRYIASRIEFRRRLLEERLKNERNEELMDMKLQFFTEISHEFRTPLTLIIDPLERLISGNPGNEKVKYYYRLMHRNAGQLLDLINKLLDFRKLQSKNLPLKAVTSDLVAFARNIAASFENQAAEQHIRFGVQASQQQMNVDFDPDKMRMILNNLISNAFKFTAVGGEIVIRVRPDENIPEKVILEVQDNGVGIAPEFHDKIFNVFYQVEGTPAQKKGSGLGLALTRELVLLHGGEINLISGIAKGVCFRITLPFRQDEREKAVEDTQVDMIPVETPAFDNPAFAVENNPDLPLLLVVDDNADIRDYIRMNFAGKYNILTAANGLEGYETATGSVPDVIVSDIMMPEISGIELCRRLKTDERTSHIPVILLTARQSDESKVEGYETGADAYVTKPFSTDVLAARMSNLLEQRQKLRQLFSNGSPVELKKIAINVTDEIFLNKVMTLIHGNMEDGNFDPDKLAEYLKMSRSQLYRKIKALTNRTVHDFITMVRMNKALEYLINGEYSISETAYKVGYSLPTNFTRTFTKQFGVSPSGYLGQHRIPEQNNQKES